MTLANIPDAQRQIIEAIQKLAERQCGANNNVDEVAALLLIKLLETCGLHRAVIYKVITCNEWIEQSGLGMVIMSQEAPAVVVESNWTAEEQRLYDHG